MLIILQDYTNYYYFGEKNEHIFVFIHSFYKITEKDKMKQNFSQPELFLSQTARNENKGFFAIFIQFTPVENEGHSL